MELDFLGDLRRTHTCGALRSSEEGARVVLMGWVNRRRDLGNLIFIDLRDRTGVVQAVFNRELSAALHDKAAALRSEFVVVISGTVKKREPATTNPNLPTGEIEIIAQDLRLLNESKNPPFLPGESGESTEALANEELRLKYRYIDLRRPAKQANIELRHKVALAIRNFLSGLGFLEIETPFMTRSTPEGARDYLVPSRVYPGAFYALPQSPQLFKQILMISGFDKYFQIVRCFRDEDLRADRQPEFTQIDLEMTFPQQETIFDVTEGFLTAAFAAAGVSLAVPFQRMTYDQAIRQYGSDKPDLRLPPMADVRQVFTQENLDALTLTGLLPVVAIVIPKVGELSRRERDDTQLKAQRLLVSNIKVITDWKRLEKSFPSAAAQIRELVCAAPEDLVVLVGADSAPDTSPKSQTAVYTEAGGLRWMLSRTFADRHGLLRSGNFQMVWVTDFPMFEFDEKESRWNAAHHPFTSPHDGDMEKLGEGSDLGAVRALAYDVVLNGTELGSGSIRIHRQDVQRKIFAAMGISNEDAQSRFGFFLDALEYGTPPHGGIALGLDRIVMILAGAQSLREVIPFPKTARAVDLMVDAPTPVSDAQLRELGIQVKK